MEKPLGIFDSIADLLAKGESLVLATIVSRSGSAPRAAGTRMVVKKDTAIVGTIGGGGPEALVRNLAREVFGHGQAILQNYEFTAQDASQLGMICGGQIQVLVQYLDVFQPGTLELYGHIAAALKGREPARLILELPRGPAAPEPVAQWLVKGDGTIVGDPEHQHITGLTGQTGNGRPEVISHLNKLYYLEALSSAGTVYIFGAGHVSRQLAPLTGLVGFRTAVLDDRQEFADRKWFPGADEVVVLESFQQALAGLAIDADSYLVLVTRGHAHDQTVLRQALLTTAGYIGMIGSRRKRDAIFRALEQEGFSRADFHRVSSPIGINIEAETPEEIAVSIVAELIQVRAGKNR